MTRSLTDLKKEAQLLGLPVAQSGRRPARGDYIDVLRDYYLKQDFLNGLPYEELTPMLCFDYWSLSPKEQKAIWKNHDWICQEKINGVRLILHFVKGVGVFAHSRTVSVHTYRQAELTDHLLFQDFIPDFTATVDTEGVAGSLQTTTALLHTSGEVSRRLQQEKASLRFHVFDIVRWQGQDLKLRTFCERSAFLKDFREAISGTELGDYFAFPSVFFQGKREVFEKILADGGEGVVLKNLNYHYEDSNSRSRWGWVKCKRQIELTAYVSGFEQGKPGSNWADYVSCLIFSVSTEKGNQAIAKVSNLPWQFRKDISLRDRATSTVKMNMDVYGRVATISGLEMSRKAFRLVHPRIVHWRSDLGQEHCVYDLKELQASREGSAIQPSRVVGEMK